MKQIFYIRQYSKKTHLTNFIQYFFMSKSFLHVSVFFLGLLFGMFLGCAAITPKYILPTRTTEGALTDYAVSFSNSVAIDEDAQIKLTFPFEFDPRALTLNKGCKIRNSGSAKLISFPCTLTNRTFTLSVGSLATSQQVIVVVANIMNPTSVQLSSDFNIATLFKNVIVDKNLQFGKTLFTKSPANSITTTVKNYQNLLINQGSSWTFEFTLTNSYPTNSSLRFIFPPGFESFKIQCGISGLADTNIKTRVFPQLNIYDCQNINKILTGYQKITLSGVVNPEYEMTFDNVEVHVLKPNNLVVVQKILMSNIVTISHKQMNATVTIPNNYRNNTIRYIFEINMDSDLQAGDYFEINFDGRWTFFANQSTFIQGINSDSEHQVMFDSLYSSTLDRSSLYIRNFSSVSRASQIAFYLSLRTPLNANDYDLLISAKKSHGGLVEKYQTTIHINDTTGYIKEIRLHPMVQPIKLPVDSTGPLEITLGLLNNLPQTNVLTYGRIYIQISPKIPYPPADNGVPKCYWYGDIEAESCTYDDSTDKTIIEATTPVDYNFQSSEIPFMVTTEGYIDEDHEGLKIHPLVTRYNFEIEFFSSDKPGSEPTQVIFSSWEPNPLLIDVFSCEVMSNYRYSYDHLTCTFTTPPVTLNGPGYEHIFRVEFTGAGWHSNLGYSSDQTYTDYPCLLYGDNIVADPYVKCDLITWKSGPYKSLTGTSYVNMYGFEELPGNSVIKFEIPLLYRNDLWWDYTQVQFSILQETWGEQSPVIRLYSAVQTLPDTSTGYAPSIGFTMTPVTSTLTNSVINKVTDITLNSIGISSGVDSVIFEVDKTIFENIGRQQEIACGAHICSKFDYPVQYFRLYPQTTLTSTETFTFPNIVTPPYAGDFEFRIRTYKNDATQNHLSFLITIDPQQLDPPLYQIDSNLQTVTTLYPNTDHYYSIGFTTKNDLPEKTSFIQIFLDNVFVIVSDYCIITTTAPAADERGIECELWVGENKILIENLGEVSAGTAFSISILLTSSTALASVAPTVSITTYYSAGNKVDYYNNGPFTPASLTVTNLQTYTSFNIYSPQVIQRPPTISYFGPLLLHFKARTSASSSIGYYLLITLTSDFYPYGDTLGLPLSCKINTVRFSCSYSLNPFEVIIQNITDQFTYNVDNLVNITTEFQEHDGIYYPTVQGKYLITAHFLDQNSTTIEKVEQYSQILPGQIDYFNVSFAHRDKNRVNIFEVNFRTGSLPIPAFNHGTAPGRIYIGFPTLDENSNAVFASDLGFTAGTGSKVPCWFRPGLGITPLSGQELECRLIKSFNFPPFAYVEVINFDEVAANSNVHIILGKIMNPAAVHVDIDFQFRATTQTASTKEETPLYISYYNMFFNMNSPAETSVNEADTTTAMFDPSAEVGDSMKYMNVKPYTVSNSGAFSTGDWYIMEMYNEFPLEDSVPVDGCTSPYYDHCIVFPEINWLMVKIGNTSILDLRATITKMPTSLSRVLKQFTAYTFKSTRYAEVITYTITPARWMELQGEISNFEFTVLGSHDKLNINQKNVEVMIEFDVQHQVNRQGTIEIRWPQNAAMVPSIKPHCRSAVSMNSQLYGDPGTSSTNVQGQLGCLIQNDYSWIITSFDTLPANKHVAIVGVIDFPTAQTASLGTGQIITYGTTHSSDTRTNGRIIDYASVNFPLQVNNMTWNIDTSATLYRSEPLRVSFVGEFKFKIRLGTQLENLANGGKININLWRVSTMGASNGFSGPTSNVICTIRQVESGQEYGCQVVSPNVQTYYINYRVQSYEALPSTKNYIITITTETGTTANDGISYPTSAGVYKVDTQIDYSSSNSQHVSQVHFLQVFGPTFNTLKITSTVDIPDQLNFILIQFVPSSNILTNQQVVIEIPTVSIDGQNMISVDLGMGYKDYDDLEFDIYESSISSMACKVYVGDTANDKPVKIVCSSFSATLTTSTTVKMGFWIKNPSTTKGLAIPIFFYAYNPVSASKFIWNLKEAAIRVLPTAATPIVDRGNFALSSTYRQTNSLDFVLTTRNTQSLLANDLYILKFNFDLRKEKEQAGKLKYNSAYPDTGDVIYMRNCQTVILRLGSTPLTALASAVTTLNAKILGVFYSPPTQLTSSQSEILGFAAYLSTRKCQKVIYSDSFPVLSPKKFTSTAAPSITLSAIHSNLRKLSRQDYTISVKASASDTSADMSLVKKISIMFPPYATYNLQFEGTQCIEDRASAIEIKDCLIDPTTRTIWINVIQKPTYANNHQLKIETMGLAIRNPTSLNTNAFVVKYYTWPDGFTEPAIISGSDDYVFLKADSTNLPSNAITFTESANPIHDKIQIPETVYINEYLPDSSSITKRTPFQFVFKAQTNFADLANSGNYHTISVKFDSYYSYSSMSSSNDLFYRVPICELDGARINQCSISGGKIIMNFQKPLVSGTEYGVRFSIINPQNPSEDGFYLTTANTETASLPIQIWQNSGTKYYGEAQPFPTYYRMSDAVYPQQGITSVTLVYGTEVFEMLNYLEFNLVFARTDINGLVLEIPVKNQDGKIIYNDPTMLDLPSGSKFPCSVGIDLPVFCYYQKGTSDGYGKPTRIYVTQFSLQSTNQLSLRILFKNPDILGVYPSFIFKAYAGTAEDPHVMGRQFAGSFGYYDAFKTIPKVGYSSTSTCSMQPNKGLYLRQTSYRFYQSIAQEIGEYAVAKWVMTHQTYGQIAEYEVVTADIYDYFIVRYSDDLRILYMVKKFASRYNGGSNYYSFGYLRQKHFIDNSFHVYLLQKPNYVDVTCTVDLTYYRNNQMTNNIAPTMVTLDVEDRILGQTSWQYLQVDLGTPQSMLLSTSDPSQMILVIKFVAGIPFSSLPSSTDCTVQGGVTSEDKLVPVTCSLNSGASEFAIYGISRFTSQNLKIYYKAVLVGTEFTDTQVQVRAYANQQAFTNQNWVLWKATTSNAYNMTSMVAYNADNVPFSSGSRSYNYLTFRQLASGWVRTSGSAKIIDLSSNYIRIRLYQDTNFGGSGANYYAVNFHFYAEKLTFTGCGNQRIYSQYHGTTIYTDGNLGCSVSGHTLVVTFSTGLDINNNHDFAYWQANTFYDILVDISRSDSHTSGAHGIYLTASVSYYQITYTYNQYTYCPCCSYDCYIVNTYGTFFLTGRNTNPYPDESDISQLSSSASITLSSRQLGVEAQLELFLGSLQVNVGPSSGTYLLMKFDDLPTFPSNNPFPDTYSTQLGGAYIDCKCVAGNPLTITYSTSYTDATCVRYLISNTNSVMASSVGIWMDATSGQDLRCYFPGFRTSSSTSMNVDVFRMKNLFFPRPIPIDNYWGDYGIFDLTQSAQGSSSSSMSISEPNLFWSNRRSYDSYSSYTLTLSGNTLSYPDVYISMYGPKPPSNICSSTSFRYCRVYLSFMNRRYYIATEQNSGSDNSFDLSGTVYFPPSCDYDVNYYKLFTTWGQRNDYYYYAYNQNRDKNQLSPSYPANSLQQGLFGAILYQYGTTIVFLINLNGRTLYSSKRTGEQFSGSFIRVSVPSATINGCSATFQSGTYTNKNSLSCKVSGSTVEIRSFEDISFGTGLHVFVSVVSMPTSTATKIQLFDKYISGTDYARSVYVTNSLSNSPSGYTIIPVTDIKWRRQVYKQYLTTSGPLRFTFQNNYQYVSYKQTADNPNSDGFQIEYPSANILAADKYVCFAKEYPPAKKYLYKQYQCPCYYETTNIIEILPPYEHSFDPQYQYEIIIFKNIAGTSGFITTNTANQFTTEIRSISSKSSNTIVNEDFIMNEKYFFVQPFTLNSIYLLNKEAGVKNSLYIDFTFSQAGAGFQYFQFEFDSLGLSSFDISNGEIISCFLSTDFGSISGKTKTPECRGYAHGINLDSPLIIRVLHFDSFSAGTRFELAFDEFNNPAKQTYKDTPINLKLRMVDRANNKVHISEFPSIYVSDSFDIDTPILISSSLYQNNAERGVTQTQEIHFTWPYTTSTGISEKIAVKIEGGITSQRLFENIGIRDNANSSWSLLWRDTTNNMSVYRVPPLSSTSREIWFTNVLNPYPTRKQTYEELQTFSIKFYKDYNTRAILDRDQVPFSSYTTSLDLNVQHSSSPAIQQRSPSNAYHNYYPMIYDLTVSTAFNSYSGRNLDNMIIRFTAGVSSIEQAYIKTSSSTVVNSLLQVNIFKEAGTNYWCLNIPGLNDNAYNTGVTWIIRVRFYANANTVSYRATVYADNGEIQFVDDLQSQTVSSDGYSSSGQKPQAFDLFEQRYVYGYYEMKRIPLNPTAGLTTNRLAFRFTTPYLITQLESFNINLGMTTTLIPKNTPNTIFCVIQPSHSSQTVLGYGLYSACSYSNGVYSIPAPISGLSLNQEYTISILELDEKTSEFVMPTVPVRYEIPIIYNSELGLQYGDTYLLNFAGKMLSYSVSHLIRKAGEYNTIGFTFSPKFTLGAASLTSPVTESVLQISFERNYFPSCLGVDSYYSTDGMFFESGTFFSHYSEPSSSTASTRVLCGQYAESYAPVRLSVTDYSEFTQSSSYYFRFTLLKNPASALVPLIYRVRLLHYENTKHYPLIKGQFWYTNKLQTVSGSSNTYSMYISPATQVVQQTWGLNVIYNSFDPAIGSQTHVKYRNNAIKAFDNISPMLSLSQTNFTDYEFYPNINLCIFRKTAGSTDSGISLGSFLLVDDIQSFTISWVYNYPSLETSTVYRSSMTATVTSSIADNTYYPTKSISKVVGSLITTNSVGIYRISFTSSLRFKEGGQIKITLTSNFEVMQNRCKQMSGFVMSTNNQLVCQKQTSTSVIIRGYSTIAANTPLTVTLYLRLAVSSITSYSNSATIFVKSAAGNSIVSGPTSTYTFSTTDYGSDYFKLDTKMYQKLRKDTTTEFEFSFRLATHTLTTGGYIVVDFGNWTIDEVLIEGQAVWRYKVGNDIYWVPTAVENTADNIYKMLVEPGYNMRLNEDIRVKLYHELPDTYSGIKITEIQWNRLKIQAYDSGDTLLEHQYTRIWIQPDQHLSLNVNPVLKYVGASTLYEFTFTPNVAAAAGDVLILEFATSDTYQTALFDNQLGFTIDTNSSKALSCHQIDHTHIISDEIQLPCELFAGDSLASPPIPTSIRIPIEKAISAGTTISFNILNIQNPPTVTAYPIQITVKLMDLCDDGDINNPCTYYRSTQYLTFNDAPVPITSIPIEGSLSTNNNLVYATNVVHTLSASRTVNNGDYLKIIYYPEIRIPDLCTITSGNGQCYSYPEDNTIIIKASSTQSGSYSFSFNSMTNLYQKKGNTDIYTEIWDSATGQISRKLYTDYTYTHITTYPTSSDPLTMTFTPTRTPNYQLKYNFPNTVRIDITHLMQNEHISMIYIQAPSIISFLGSYCNATFEATTIETDPYPYRLQCRTISTRYAKIFKTRNFPEFDPATHKDKIISVYLTYYISSGTTSPLWYARAYTADYTATTQYLVSQASGYFLIDPYQHPQISKINFYTKAFKKRTCKTNQLCMFYGYLLPSTVKTDHQIGSITYTIPEEFGYSNSKTYDICRLQKNTADIYNNKVTCSAVRTDSEVILTHTPSVGYYQHEYQLVTVDNTDQSKLFLSPAYPGSQYQMKVNLYSNDATPLLLQSTMVNLTSVYGQYLDYDKIDIQIPMDADSNGLFRFQFEVGAEDVPPAYESSINNKIVSEMHIVFSKSFSDDLGTARKSGEEIACVPLSGMTFYSTGKLTCKIYPAYSTITYPRIQLTGYDRITGLSTVAFLISGLKTLPENVDDYIKMGVALTYYDYGNVQGYLYEMTGIVVGGTTAPDAIIAINPLTVTETSSNFVGDLVNYTFSGTIGGGSAPVTATDYVSIEFEQNCFEGVFSQNLLAVSSLASVATTYSFGLSRIIYFQPTSSISSGALSFSLNNMINSAYSMEYLSKTFKVTTYVNSKINAQGTATLTKFSKPSQNISALVLQLASIYGGDAGINYTIEFKLNSNLPENGVITITFPELYESLFSLSSKCILDEPLASEATYCEIINEDTISIVVNGYLFESDATYSINLTNITNPNSQDLSSQTFTITTYYDSNIYKGLIIASSSFAPPQISLMTVKQCETFEVTLGAYNPNYTTSYDLTLICPNMIKVSSSLKIYLSWQPDTTTSTLCESSTESLYSEECKISEEYVKGSRYRFLQAYLREISPQKLISISASVKNPEKGTYTLIAQVSYKGFTYIRTVSKEFFITQETVQTNTLSIFHVKNYPKNRDENAVFVFNLTNIDSSTSIIKLSIPDFLHNSDSEALKCVGLGTTFVQDYFHLLQTKYSSAYTMINCQIKENILILDTLQSVLKPILSTELPLRVAVFSIINPSLSEANTKFTVTFLKNQSSYPSAIATQTFSKSYQVSQTPSNLLINRFSSSSHKFYSTSEYSISIEIMSGGSLKIAGNTTIGILIKFPEEYKKIWNQIKVPPTFVANFDSLVLTSTSPQLAYGSLMSRFALTSEISFSDIELTFTFRNPNTTLDCSVPPIFQIVLYDFKLNTIVAETLANNIQCPVFQNRLYTIEIVGNTNLRAGSAQIFTINLQKPASYLKIEPKSSMSAIEFEPEFIEFKNYSKTSAQFKIKASDSLTGNYTITFTKTEVDGKTYFQDITDEELTISVPVEKYNITFGEVDAKSMGLAIPIEIRLSHESSREITLLYNTDCTALGYSLEPSLYMKIPSGTTRTELNIKYNNDTVSQKCKIEFDISSLSNHNYQIPIKTLYVSSSLSLDKAGVKSVMRLKIGPTPTFSSNVGAKIATVNDLSSIKPAMYTLKKIEMFSNSGLFEVSISDPGIIYFAAIKIGVNRRNIIQEDIYNNNVSSAVSYGNAETLVSSSAVSFTSNFTILSLMSQTNYLIAAYLNSSIGISDISFLEAKTSKAPNGAAIKIALSEVEDFQKIISALAIALTLPVERLTVLTFEQILLGSQSAYAASVMNTRQYVYEIVLGPDLAGNGKTPIEVFAQFTSSADLQSKFKEEIPTFIAEFAMPYHEIILEKPKFRPNNPLSVKRVTFSSIRIQVAMWSEALVSTVLIKKSELPETSSAIYPMLSEQIIQGYTPSNSEIISEHKHSRTLAQEENNYEVQFDFTLLEDDTDYVAYVTAESVIPYDPKLVIDDDKIETVQVKTQKDLNMMKNQGIVVDVLRKEVGDDWADDVQEQIVNNQRKQQITGANKSKKTRIFKE